MDKLVGVYGSLLYSKEREKMLGKEGKMAKVGVVERKGWKLSFDRYSRTRREAVLNLVYTCNSTDMLYSMIYRVDDLAYKLIMKREMGEQTVRKWQNGRLIGPNCYRPIQLDSKFGITDTFIIPDEGRERSKRTQTTREALYVDLVKKGIEESYDDEQCDVNLRALERAVKESQIIS